MFKEFFEFVGEANDESIASYDDFMKHCAGKSFLNGLYRVLKTEDIEKWTSIVCEAFPSYLGKISVFGYDWLGRCFALNLNRNSVLLFEPGTGEVLNIPADFTDFHNVEIAEYHADSLASEFFDEWREANGGCVLPYGKCTGYKVPLFLSGEDVVENLEVSDMEVYWGLMAPLMNM